MSHFTRIRLEMREREHLLGALEDLGCRVGKPARLEATSGEAPGPEVRAFGGKRERVDILVETGSEYDIGLRLGIDGYEVVADWWGVESFSPFRRESFLARLRQRYAYRVIRSQAREQNLIVEDERILENGDVVVILAERG